MAGALFDALRAGGRLAWAATLLGSQKLGAALAPTAADTSRGSARAGGRSLDDAAWRLQARLDGPFRAAFEAGVDLDDELAATGRDAAARPQAVARALARRASEALRLAEPGERGRALRQELRNKYEVYWLVRGVRRHLALPPPGVAFPLLPYLERALRADDVRALWLVEGLAHDWVEARLDRAGALPAAETTRTWARRDVPDRVLPMLHAGMGLAFAERLLAPFAAGLDPARAGEVLAAFVDRCRAGALPCHLAPALESLGLVVRCFFPRTMAAMNAVIESVEDGGDASIVDCYWHGIGRGTYFAPASFVPGFTAVERALHALARTVPAGAPRRAAETGLGYAFTLVNLGHPEILEALLAERGEVLDGSPLADGMAAAIAARARITPRAPILADLLEHRPARRPLLSLWQATVAAPARLALEAEAGASEP